MKTIHTFLFYCIFCSCVITANPAMSTEVGVGFGQEFRDNTDLQQYEVFIRQPLPFKKEFDSGFQVLSAVEVGAAMLREKGGDSDEGGRILAMPQMILSPHPRVNGIIGFGAGFMFGETRFGDQDLGGDFMLASKIGIQFLLGQHWNVGYVYYHQSNGGIYEHNNGLNMHNIIFSYSF